MAYKQKHRTLSSPKQLSKRDQRHYWPYLPLLVVTLGLSGVLFMSNMRARQVLGSSQGLSNQTLLATTNQTRLSERKADLKDNQALTAAAQAKADDMVARDYWSHTTPDGKQPWSFVDETGYKYQIVGENLAYGFSSSDEVIRGWLNSPSHRDNLLSNDYTDVGFGVADSKDFNGSGPETVVVAMYGKPGHMQVGKNQQVLGQSSSPSFGITRLETLSGSNGDVLVFIAGILVGITVLALLVKHLAALKRVLVDGERFVIHHPLLDVTLVSLLVLGTFLAQTSGFVR